MTAPDKQVPESVYRRHVLRARSTRNHFTFSRDWTYIMSRLEALFLQYLVNRASNPKVPKRILCDPDGTEREYVLLSQKYLSKPPMAWDIKIQASYLASLKEKGFVKISNNGWKKARRCRWVHVDLLAIETAIDEVSKTIQKRNVQNIPKAECLNDPKAECSGIQNNPKTECKESSCRKDKVHEPESSLSGGFADPTNSSRNGFDLERSKSDPRDHRRALLLWNRLVEKGLLDKKSKFKNWIEEFASLRDKDGIPDNEIEETLLEYLPLISITMSTKEEFCIPQAFSAKTFRAKFIAIRTRLACRKKGLEKSQVDEDLKELRDKVRQAEEESGFSVDKEGNIRVKIPGGGGATKIVPRDDEMNGPWKCTIELADAIRRKRGENVPPRDWSYF